MLGKLNEKKAGLEAKKAALLSELKKVDNKISIVNEMIAEETPAPVPVVSAVAVEETEEKRTIEFGSVTRSSF